MSNTYTFTDEELQCLRVCLQNAPTPYHISKKKIVGDLEDKIGKPIVEKRYMHINWLGAYIMLAEKWLDNEHIV